MRRNRSYDQSKIEVLLERVLADIGPARFSEMRLLHLERLVRTYDPGHELPGKTVLRAAINTFRTARWPGCAPKKVSARFQR
jgi:hypothetical protein